MRGGLADRVSELRERPIGEAVLAQPLDHLPLRHRVRALVKSLGVRAFEHDVDETPDDGELLMRA
jgi:hypothetical protein